MKIFIPSTTVFCFRHGFRFPLLQSYPSQYCRRYNCHQATPAIMTAVQYMQYVNKSISQWNKNARSFNDGDASQICITMVLGNESCDLDSMVSALLLAMHRGEACKLKKELKGNQQKRVYVPVFNTAREDFHLRGEASFVLAMAGLTEKQLIFYDEYTVKKWQSTPEIELHVVLVDHNELPVHQAYLQPNVVAVVDHHEPTIDWMHLPQPSRIAWPPCGSCTSLVVDEILSSIKDKQQHIFADHRLAMVGLSAVLIDTGGRDKPKAKQVDIAAIDNLTRLSHNSVEYNDELLSALTFLRSDVSKLTPYQLLKRDAKTSISTNCAPFIICSVPVGLEVLFSNPANLLDEMERYARSRHALIIIILTNFHDSQQHNQHRRQIMLNVLLSRRDGNDDDSFRSKILFDLLCNQLMQDIELKLEPLPLNTLLSGRSDTLLSSSASLLAIWEQHNVEATRKYIMPLVERILHSSKL